MNGSEKQVQWAEDIKTEVAMKVAAYRDYYQNRFEQKGVAADDPRWETITEANSTLDYLNRHDEAKWWIENLKGFGKTIELPGVPVNLRDEGMRIVEKCKALAYDEARRERMAAR